MTKVIANVTNEFIYKMYSYNFASTCKLNTLRSGIILQVFHGQKVVNKANTVSLTCTIMCFFFFLQKEKLLLMTTLDQGVELLYIHCLVIIVFSIVTFFTTAIIV